MSGARVSIDVQGLEEAELTVLRHGSGVKPRLVSAYIKGDGVTVSLLDDATNVRRVLTGLLAQLDAIEADR